MGESFFTRHTKEKLSGKSAEQLDTLHNRNLNYDTAALEQAAGPLERAAGNAMRDIIRKGKDNPDKHERFATHFEQCTDEPILTLVYSGLDDPDSVDDPPSKHESWIEVFAKESMMQKAAAAGMKIFRGPQLSDMYPDRGLRCTFRGPNARAAYSDTQLNKVDKATRERTLEVVDNFTKIYGRDAKIIVWGFSAGTRDAAGAMKDIGDFLGRPVDDCTFVSPGTSMGLGTFAAWCVSPSADALKEQGYTAQSYHQATYETSQEAALNEGKHLPAGRNLKVIFGTHDTIIPPYQPGGTIDFIKMARERGLAPKVIEYKGLDHITMPAEIMWQHAYGNDPTFIHNRSSLWSIPETYTDPLCIRKLDDVLSRFSPEELPFFAELVSERNGTTVMEDMDPYTHAIADWLIKHEICNVATGPRYLWVRNKEDLVDKADPSIKAFRKRIVAHELPRVIRELKAVDHDENFKPLYEMTEEEKRPKLVRDTNL